MTNDLEKANLTDRIARFQSVNAGMYWRALQDIPEFAITEGMVLLIQSIRYVDDAPHTIIVRAHPDNYDKRKEVVVTDADGHSVQRTITCTTHRFLTEDFLQKFEFEPDHEAVRTKELASIQAEITALQVEMAEAQTNPAILNKAVEDALREDAEKAAQTSEDSDDDATPQNLPALPENTLATAAKGTLAEVIGSGITQATVGALKGAARREHRIATIKSNWLQSKTTQIGTTIQAMTPYYKEQAAAALARTEDVREYVDKLMKGIETLDLYTGKDVHVDTICKGASAPASEPLTCVQAKLSMEEELAIWEDLDDTFDHRDQELFFDALGKHPELVRQVFPTERCILLMYTTSRLIDYGSDPLTSALHDRENRKVFLMVRDGENIYRVVSSVESHLNAGRLFPSKDDNDQHFRGIDGSRITLQDVTYTDRLARHEDAVLHYKRFLILLCGLDHRLQLFGQFYEGPQDFTFVTAEFQEKHLRFIHDDDGEGMLPAEERPSFESYINTLNSVMQSGSRVLCIWRAIMNPKTAPSCCLPYSYGHDRGYDWQYKPDNAHDICIAQRSGQDLFVKISVSGETRSYEPRTFDAKVTLRFGPYSERRYYGDDYESEQLPYLCLDMADPDLLEWYIHNRKTRRFHLRYIKTFKRAVAALRADRMKEKATRARMLSAVTENKIATEAQAGSIIDQSVAAWRATNRGADLPDFDNGEGTSRQWKALLDQMYLLAGAGEDRAEAILRYASKHDLTPLRISLSGNGVMLLYAAPSAAERDDRAEPFVWVRRLMTKASKDGVSVSSERWALLEANPPGETIIRQFDAVDEWIGKASVFTSPMQKADAIARAEGFAERLKPFTSSGTELARENELRLWDIARDRQMQTSKYVTRPSIAIPMGLTVKDGEPVYLCVGTDSPVGMISRHAEPAFVEAARAEYSAVYAKKSAGRNFFDTELTAGVWKLVTVPVRAFPKDHSSIYLDRDLVSGWYTGIRQDEFDPRLSPLLAKVRDKMRSPDPIWIATEALESDGTLIADTMLGLELPDGFAPVTAREVTIMKGGTGIEALKWIDILPRDEADRHRVEPPTGYAMRSSTFGSYLNLDEAQSDISERLKDRITEDLEVPFSLPDVPTGTVRILLQ